MIDIRTDIIKMKFKDMGELADIIAELNHNGLDLINDGMNSSWLVTNATQTHKYIIEDKFRGINELRELAKQDLNFILK